MKNRNKNEILEPIDKSKMSPADYDIARKAQLKGAMGILLDTMSEVADYFAHNGVEINKSDVEASKSQLNDGTLDLNEPIGQYFLPLHAAAMLEGRIPTPIIPILIDGGADPHKRLNGDYSPFEFALEMCLKPHLPKQSEKVHANLIQMVNKSEQQHLYATNFSNNPENSEATLLHFVRNKSVIKSVRNRFKELGVSKEAEFEFLNKKDNHGQTALHFCASKGDTEAIEALVAGLEPKDVYKMLNERSNLLRNPRDFADNPRNIITFREKESNPIINLLNRLEKDALKKIQKSSPIQSSEPARNINLDILLANASNTKKAKAKNKKKPPVTAVKEKDLESVQEKEVEKAENPSPITATPKETPIVEKEYLTSADAEEFLTKRFTDLLKEHNHTPESFAKATVKSQGIISLPANANNDGSPSEVILPLANKPATLAKEENLESTSFASLVNKKEKASYFPKPSVIKNKFTKKDYKGGRG